VATLERCVILVKAWPQPSRKYIETVCCAGVTPDGAWRRLFPIRFRHLDGARQFKRWDIIEYEPQRPNDDRRAESRRVNEPTLHVVGALPEPERERLLRPLMRSSEAEAASRGESLALVRPRNVKFKCRRKTAQRIEAERLALLAASAQGSLFDKELAALEPCPYAMALRFDDASGGHLMQCSDWETRAAFFHLRPQYGEAAALEHLRKSYEEDYLKRGLALALGTMKKRPRQWLLLGILRVDEPSQGDLFS
jgi:hypothetical protein